MVLISKINDPIWSQPTSGVTWSFHSISWRKWLSSALTSRVRTPPTCSATDIQKSMGLVLRSWENNGKYVWNSYRKIIYKQNLEIKTRDLPCFWDYQIAQTICCPNKNPSSVTSQKGMVVASQKWQVQTTRYVNESTTVVYHQNGIFSRFLAARIELCFTSPNFFLPPSLRIVSITVIYIIEEFHRQHDTGYQ